VIATSDRCPFCDAPASGIFGRLVDRGGRMSRAAVFAGLAACYTSSPAPKETTPPPPPPPDDTVQTQQDFAKPPDGATDTGSIEGSVVDAFSNQPIGNSVVWLQTPDGAQQQARADASGRFRFDKLAPGNYVLWSNAPGGNPRQGPQRHTVTVTASQSANATIAVQPYVPDRGPCCKPYGAPPARRRVV
jgi:hypothetical protein